MSTRQEVARMVASLTAACAIGAAVLGGVYVVTERYQAAASLRTEREAITQLLSLDAGATIEEIEMFLDPGPSQVVYAAHAFGAGEDEGERLTFSLDGRLVARASPRAHDAGGPASGAAGERKHLIPLGKVYVARVAGTLAGFVGESTTRGYKNRIRYLVALTPAFEIAGVRVVEHEEDPGLGAEVATRAFEGQFIGRSAEASAALDVTRDPMPEDWRAALAQLTRTPVLDWRAAHADLVAREGRRPIYAVTGATISSRALTDGVRATVERFRRRWEMLAAARAAAPVSAAAGPDPGGVR
jgi:H+/Na+-translocating ferredoxin:NAD+ oxidoreductase subunit G